MENVLQNPFKEAVPLLLRASYPPWRGWYGKRQVKKEPSDIEFLKRNILRWGEREGKRAGGKGGWTERKTERGNKRCGEREQRQRFMRAAHRGINYVCLQNLSHFSLEMEKMRKINKPKPTASQTWGEGESELNRERPCGLEIRSL